MQFAFEMRRVSTSRRGGEIIMATTNGTQTSSLARFERDQYGLSAAKRSKPRQGAARVNVGNTERQVSLAAGAVAAILGIARRDVPGLLMTALGAALVFRGASGHCGMYQVLGMDSREAPDSGRQVKRIQVVESFLIDRPVEALYSFWRDLEKLPAIMSHLKSVHAIDERRSHWIARAPKIAGGSVGWDAEIVEDRPNERITWRSLPGADVDNQGTVEFKRAPGNRGTAVRVTMKYAPPVGRIGSVFVKLFGENPERQIHEDLRRFKRVMEIGESLTTEGQSRGSCFGVGRLMS
jgi:uncharacterized membrane protein